MEFVSKEIAIILKEKGFDKPCFGYYYIETPTGMNEGEIIYNKCNTRGAIYKDCLYSSNYDYYFDSYLVNKVDSPTIEQVLEWLREEKDIDIVIYPVDRNTIYMGGEKYILSIYFCGKRIYEIHKDNNDKFVKYEDACIAGIEYVINNLI